MRLGFLLSKTLFYLLVGTDRLVPANVFVGQAKLVFLKCCKGENEVQETGLDSCVWVEHGFNHLTDNLARFGKNGVQGEKEWLLMILLGLYLAADVS